MISHRERFTLLSFDFIIHCFQEIDVQGKKAIIIFVPVPQLRAYQKIQTRLVRELEKKFSGKHVVFIAQVMLIGSSALFSRNSFSASSLLMI